VLQGRTIAQQESTPGAIYGPQGRIFLLGDHLGSVSVVTDTNGQVVSRQDYTPWGEARGSDITQTTLNFTGQRKDGTGLLYYGARYYDPVLGRFLSPDSIVPGNASGKGGMAATLGQDGGAALRPLTVDFHEPGFAVTLAQEDAFTQAKGFRFQLSDQDKQQGEGAKWQWGPANPQALNRYAYVLDNPLRYTDPSGHFIIAIPAAVAALFTAEVLADVVALSWLHFRPGPLRGVLVSVVEAAQHRHGMHRPAAISHCGGSWRRRRLPEALVRPIAVEVRDVLPEHAGEVALAEDQHVVEALAAHAPQEALAGRVRLRGADGRA